MKFKISMIYLLIPVVFGLVTANLMYNVEKCDQTIQRYVNSRHSTEFSQWINWARVFSFCRYLNSTYDYGCKTLDCKECLTVCLMDDEIRSVTSLCEQNCTTNACKKGCRFYYEVFINSSVVAHKTAIKKPKIKNRSLIARGLIINGLNFSWSSAFSDDAFEIPSLYFVRMDVYRRDDKILTLTENSHHFVQGKDMCRDASVTNPHSDLKFEVVPINFVTIRSSIDYYNTKIDRSLELLSNVTVSKPFFVKSVEDDIDHIVWDIEWKGMFTNTTEGFQVRYQIYDCSVFTNFIEMRKLNPEKIHLVRDESFRMRIRNTDDDKLDTCSIFLELRTRHQCFFEKPYTTIIKYGGCKTIPGYPHSCRVITPRPPTVTLSDNVEQCDKTVQRYIAIWDQFIPLFSQWLKWARVFSFCRYLNSTYDYGCKTLDCRQCLTVCLMDDKIRKVTSLCEKNCMTNACKEGCRFYSRVFVKSDVTHNTAIRKPKVKNSYMKSRGSVMSVIIDSSVVAHNSAIKKAKVNNRHIISEGSVMSGIDLSWPSVFSDGAFEIPSLYLVTMYVTPINNNQKNRYILILTENSRHLVQVKDMCRSFPSTFPHQFDFTFLPHHVTPINFVGPKKFEDILVFDPIYDLIRFRPVDPPSKWSVSKPFFEKSIEDNFDYIVWEIERNGSLNITNGFRVEYYIYDCPVSRDESRESFNRYTILKLNPKKVHLVKERSFRMRIANTKDDKLYRCKISLKLRIWYGECLYGDPHRRTIKYGGCNTIPGYSNPCKDTLIYEFSAKISATDCVNPFINACPQNENNTCQYCQTTKQRIKVTWEHPKYAMMVKGYTVRWGVMMRGNLIDPKTDRTVKLGKRYTSYSFDFFASELKHIGIQVHAETSRSKPRWKWQINMNSVQNITLRPGEPKLVSPALVPTKDEIIAPTIIVVIVVFFLAVSFSLALCIIYRRRSNLRKKLKRNEIKMEDKQKSGAVDKWEISYAILTIGKKIGEGAFGNVFSGFVKTIELRKTPYAEQCSGIKLKRKKVAIKFLKDNALETEYKDFFEEIKLMKDIGFHRNIVNMIGCGTITKPPYLVLEYMNGGDLLNYLRVFRKNKSCTSASLSKATVDGTGDDSMENVDHLSSHDVMSFSWQITCGMEYLSMNNVVHRDLAARNILISDNKKIKISDFGLSRFVGEELIYLSHNKSRNLPIKWMSVEAICNQEFTTASDVWAYGVVLFEIVTLGGTPYPSIGNCELCKILKSGYRMEKPENCDETVYNIMLNCWNELPTQRPSFTELRELLEDLAEKDETYFSFDIDEKNSYYNVASFKSIPSDANDDGYDAFTFTNELLKLLNLTKTTTV